ncbi:YbaB/EbfC family nucleoid-associated protein [Nocardia blacklockiae]|uniref:YbaB/EbfC family nucleoid-associated protein n=1 Tax=Nocardia blacklockiae TaxID=480036 RepID=UPI00189621BA|nr:YbaB/EbfC family nucleoid-associated protein [Nocardia blacklockiae]MBF6171454.1 YbaB/EbfC family nucleoid-associated protein [Nocardia blacklockiae]
MANEHAKRELADLLTAFDQQVRTIADIHERRARMTATGTARRKRITVTVNAEGTLIETRFSADIGDLEYADIARGVTEAAQHAAAEMTRKTAELMRPLQQQRARMPKLSDLIEGMPDLSTQVPPRPPISTAPPGAPERGEPAADSAPEFADVEEIDRTDTRRGVTDSGW